ncbi:hypothetical protein L3X38_006531 [Prunus dulcis]|uniref:Uncharacterized protein n=1 Tax=Prunus dulcis TaxID=3755 RepID=A0AAD4ZT31_PRUDU|nr:hypothetical protein L3X38_006531 [Prunus dulcis]
MIAVALKVKKDGAFTGVFNGDGVFGEGESAAGCSDGVGKGCGGDDEDTMENWTKRKARRRAHDEPHHY